MKKKIREQLRWGITCIVGLFCLWLLPSTVIAASETVYPVTTEYQEINDLAGVRDNFGLSGTTTWDTGWPWAQLTSEKTQQVGSIYLNNKVQLDSSFSINGKLSIHFKGANKNADGIGIVFHTGEVDQIGQAGGFLGVAGLPNALAMVWDTWKNEGDPNVPYIGIWTTNSSGTKSVVNNYTTSFDITKNQELNYSFIYDANTRKVTFQAYYNISSTNDSPDYSKPIITDNSGAGYSFTIPESIKEYSFSITGATGSTFNNQYVKVSNASIPILVTNTPKVTKEVGTTYSSVLTLSDTNGVAYPQGSTATVNGVDYTVDDNSSITVPLGATDTETDLTIAVKSFKEYNNQKFDGRVS
ncbi:lectin-like domain-containing protein, partial [Enterococcus sp. LJL120]|uniref:lectin-like domain-containing protein n=1 Tax=Enterococcus sp. HY326 TaxID=2971265 RepID=UPI003A0FB90F